MNWLIIWRTKRLSNKLARLRWDEETFRREALNGDEQCARDYVRTTKRAAKVAKKLRKLSVKI